MFGGMSFAASESFDAVLGSSSGFIFGGGAEVGLPWGGLYFGVGAWRFSEEGERVFVSGSEVFPLGIPLTVEVTPVEVTGGWRFKNVSARVSCPTWAGAGAAYAYKETSDFADAGENVDERFNGWHILGGAEFKVTRWLGRRRRDRVRERARRPRHRRGLRGIRRDEPRRHELPPEDQRWPLTATFAPPGPGGRQTHSGRAGHHLRRRGAAGRPPRRRPRRRQRPSRGRTSRVFPTTASSPPAASWAAIQIWR